VAVLAALVLPKLALLSSLHGVAYLWAEASNALCTIPSSRPERKYQVREYLRRNPMSPIHKTAGRSRCRSRLALNPE